MDSAADSAAEKNPFALLAQAAAESEGSFTRASACFLAASFLSEPSEDGSEDEGRVGPFVLTRRPVQLVAAPAGGASSSSSSLLSEPAASNPAIDAALFRGLVASPGVSGVLREAVLVSRLVFGDPPAGASPAQAKKWRKDRKTSLLAPGPGPATSKPHALLLERACEEGCVGAARAD